MYVLSFSLSYPMVQRARARSRLTSCWHRMALDLCPILEVLSL